MNEFLTPTPETTPRQEQIIALENSSDAETNFRRRFLDKLKATSKYILPAVMGTALTTHQLAKEYPDFIKPTPIESKQTPTWDSQTYAELVKLSKEYGAAIASGEEELKMTEEEAETRFMDFLAQYAPTIRIISPDDDVGVVHKIHSLVMDNPQRAHYEMGDILVYKQKELQKKPDGTNDYSTSGMREFISELSHHINHDGDLLRMIAYAEDLARKKMDQRAMYSDIYSSEFQAHSVTQQAIVEYLTHSQEKTFAEIYNLYQEYYRKFSEIHEYESEEDKKYLLFKYVYRKSVIIKHDKDTIFNNLNSIREILNN